MAKVARAEVEKMRGEEKDKLKAADLKGYEAGIQRATLEYTRVALKMVNDELEQDCLISISSGMLLVPKKWLG